MVSGTVPRIGDSGDSYIAVKKIDKIYAFIHSFIHYVADTVLRALHILTPS